MCTTDGAGLCTPSVMIDSYMKLVEIIFFFIHHIPILYVNQSRAMRAVLHRPQCIKNFSFNLRARVIPSQTRTDLNRNKRMHKCPTWAGPTTADTLWNFLWSGMVRLLALWEFFFAPRAVQNCMQYCSWWLVHHEVKMWCAKIKKNIYIDTESIITDDMCDSASSAVHNEFRLSYQLILYAL